jgi:hypothetical protein
MVTQLAAVTRPHVRIRIDRIEAVSSTNTSETTVRYELCRNHPGGNVHVGSQLGTDVSYACSAVVPTTGRLVTLGDAAEYSVLVLMTPHRPGRFDVSGFRLSYHEGHRWQTQTIGPDDRLTTRA